jgi:acyl carrier protein
MRDRVRGVIAEVLAVDPATLPDDAAADRVEGWDSLRHLELMLALEREFGVRIPAESFLELASLPAIEDYLRGASAA